MIQNNDKSIEIVGQDARRDIPHSFASVQIGKWENYKMVDQSNKFFDG